ncbi:CotH kinase family protein (plasmid) [Verrucomicrobiaceae bacterium 227]
MFLIGQAVAGPVISEFMASNDETLLDEDGNSSDWIEIWNPDQSAVDLGGLYLTDATNNFRKWQFPSVTLEPDERLVVFASGKNRVAVPGQLHTNFKLAAEGEYLALSASDGLTIFTDFASKFPEQYEDVSYGVGDFGEGYFTSPTPGAVNSGGEAAGPNFVLVMKNSLQPKEGEEMHISAEIEGADEVSLIYRINFEDEVSVPMVLDGLHYTATIPGANAGDLIRWRYRAFSPEGLLSKSPAFRNRDDSPEYYGTAVQNPNVESKAPVLEWFIEPRFYNRLLSFVQPVRGGILYKSVYYDNVAFTLHGQSTLFFAKKSFNIDFNTGDRFQWHPGERKVKDIDLIANWGDKAKVRQSLAFEMMRDAGVPTHFAFSVRVQQNGQFFSVADLVEDADDRYLERAGLNPEGVLYKAHDTFLRPGDIGGDDGMTKKTRKEEPNTDLHQLITGINQEGEGRWDYIYDHVDIPMTINTLASLVINMQTDMYDKNYYLYRDTGRSDEWAILPWDMDLTFGRDYREASGGYFDNDLFAAGYTEHEESSDGVSLVEFLIDGNVNTRAMFFRRLRTLSDQFLMSDYLEGKLAAQLALLDPPEIVPSDAQLDFEKWGSWRDGSPVPVAWDHPDPAVESMAEAIARFRDEWLPARRLEIANNVPDLPAAQSKSAVMFGILEDDPVSDNQEEEYIELLNQDGVAVDLSGWTISGGVSFVIPAGTVIPAGGTLYVTPNARAFRERQLSPRGGEQRFLVGPYSGKLSSEGETIDLFDGEGELQDSKTFSGGIGGFNGNGRVDLDGDGLNALLEYAMGTSDEIQNTLAVEGLLRAASRSLSTSAERSAGLRIFDRD